MKEPYGVLSHLVGLVDMALVVLLCGCGGRAPEPQLASSGPAGPYVEEIPEGGSYDPRYYPWHTYTVEQLVTLYERSDPALEVKIAGRRCSGLSVTAFHELERRMEKDGQGMDLLTPKQRDRFMRELRRLMPTSQVALVFAAKYLPALAAKEYLADPWLIQRDPLAAVACLEATGKMNEVRKFLRPNLNSLDEGKVCWALDLIATCKLKSAADEVYKRTRALRWLIRLHALHALHVLDDPRTNEALAKHLRDIERRGIGHRILTLQSAFAALSDSFAMRAELIEIIADRKVPGAADTLERILRDTGNHPALRSHAGHGLAELDFPQALNTTRRLLASDRESDQLTGAKLAEMCDTQELARPLRELLERTKSKEVRGEAQQALDSILQSSRTRPSGPIPKDD